MKLERNGKERRMVKLVDEDIKTREVLDWQGLHVFHMALSSCSQKLRIFLALKGLVLGVA